MTLDLKIKREFNFGKPNEVYHPLREINISKDNDFFTIHIYRRFEKTLYRDSCSPYVLLTIPIYHFGEPINEIPKVPAYHQFGKSDHFCDELYMLLLFQKMI